jgi:hypothetical protein
MLSVPNARLDCVARGGKLAIFSDAVVPAFINSISSMDQYCVDLFSYKTSGTVVWAWGDGSLATSPPLCATSASASAIYALWDAPNNCFKNDACSASPYICQRSI